MENLPLVSIVTPTFNQSAYLAETIESVLRQDYPNIEYIILDDGSEDQTAAILERYRGVVRFERHSNIGQARTLNKGWSMCSGQYLGYLSSDDVLLPSAISKLVECLRADASIVCAFPDANLIDTRSRVVKRNVVRAFDLAELVVCQECYIGPGALFTQAAYAKVGGWIPELKLAPDREFWMRLAEHGRFEFVPEVLAGYRFHPHSISYKDVSEAVGAEYLHVLDRYFAGDARPSAIQARKREAYGRAHLILSRNAFRSGDFFRGFELYTEACKLHPPLKAGRVKLRMIKNVVSKPVRRLIAEFQSLIASPR